MRKPAGDQPFDARLDRSAPDTGGADDVEQVAIGKVRQALYGADAACRVALV